MATLTGNAFLRSPYWVTISNNFQLSATIELWIYEGVKNVDRPTTPQYTLTSVSPNVGDDIFIDISELGRDYIESVYDGDYTCNAVWVDYRYTQVIDGGSDIVSSIFTLAGYNGYGYYEDGRNWQNEEGKMFSNNVFYKRADLPIRIPVDSDSTDTVDFIYKGVSQIKKTITDSFDVSGNLVTYATNNTTDYDTFKERVLAEGGVFVDSPCMQKFYENSVLFPVDEVIIKSTNEKTFIKVYNNDACKYPAYKITFTNKFGIEQDIWFFKMSKLSMKVNRKDFSRNTLSSYLNDDISKHQDVSFNTTAKESLRLNSDWVSEDYNEVFRQLMLSETVWITYNEQVLPINIKDSSFNYKTTVNDKLINYTINIEFSFDKINNVR